MPNKITTGAIIGDLLKKLDKVRPEIEAGFIGKVMEVTDGVAKVSGLNDLSYSEMVEFANGVLGVAINLEEKQVGVVILGDYLDIKEGDIVRGIDRLLSIGAGEDLIGRVIDPLGNSLDGKGPVKIDKYYPIEKMAPGVVKRQPVSTPLQTGIKAIDSMIPIGRGQRELIIGDRGTGKTAVTLDTIINQKGKNVVCIYVAIGQKASRIAQIIDLFSRNGALEHTIIVAANASDPASMQYIAPYTGTAIGEYFMDKGKDALVVYDDLTKHAWAYRQISLILRRPSGREAYPGDIFYLHSRLLERSARLSEKYGGGSLTALPIIETQAGDMSAYIPTNVISITDGQIYFESDLFYAGIRPAINVGLSVSRVGAAAQIKAIKQVAGRLRLDLAQYRDMAAFAQFATDLDEKTKKQIERGARMIELLKQGQFKPMSVEEQVVLFYAGTNGYLDDIETVKIADFELAYLDYINGQHKDILKKIRTEEKISDETAGKLNKLLDSFKKIFNG
ncbi:F0F1 ATP synthase subunit alpha [Candidatus Gottesmanbacteria bacterium RIFCSPLOWO2_02_FULL_42_29]|uniref:ATP synthase subunit alpha n=2 Tax=Candidatus Gottesmaniibacteriota TaxID=1752720 RepID=A0A1F6BKK0_9BACT|nr:MAG: ATP synthase subunit alpha [Candidatus Gottesmanbacteria bacterium GW2011_GWA2_42_18]OGG09425.1 MAG: F0F1 ATP synthase subunit alpha [Candidatus Gottesmanbacteria bacterium RIFCSPHIGHO2_01_FULL_42_27]OGG19517.1 MAG: F0F1 ATP synthase subunit alpha [Candidatus Gottesmanbacteria bacterium RIFCSPHIGHO2_12_FULL_43_26]OGG33542.1 MAG: F0F1 ATP synthase subunit alpha [Candidatus Gottesmanbacteria bacterium RIFCSPLOWO2_12_FULL_42_10]OGG36494.1 MAG: F0F1 ATP synthase subunit alpha [Candidatus Go